MKSRFKGMGGTINNGKGRMGRWWWWWVLYLILYIVKKKERNIQLVSGCWWFGALGFTWLKPSLHLFPNFHTLPSIPCPYSPLPLFLNFLSLPTLIHPSILYYISCITSLLLAHLITYFLCLYHSLIKFPREILERERQRKTLKCRVKDEKS